MLGIGLGLWHGSRPGGGGTPTPTPTPAPAFTTQPSISPGSGTEDVTLFTANDGAATNTTGYTRRWLLSGTAIGTGTTITPADAGSLVLEVTATGPGGSTVANSAAVTVGGSVTNPSFATAPSTTGTGNPGELLVGNDGTITNGNVSARQWLRDGTPIATGPGYTVSDADIGTNLTYRISATNAGGGSAQASSAPVAVTNPFLINDRFDSNVTGWSNDAGTAPAHNSALEDSQLGTGCMAIVAGAQTSRSFTAPATGNFRVDFWFRDDSTTTTADTTATTNIYVRLNALAVGSANAAAYIALVRNTVDGATTNTLRVARRNSTGNAYFTTLRRDGGAWWKISLVLDVTANTYDIYLNDVLYLTGITFPNTTKTTSGNITILQGAAAPTLYFDQVRVQSAWTIPAETVMLADTFTTGTAALSSTPPATDQRHAFAQNWISPTNSNVGGFTRSTNGLTYPTKPTFALARCGQEGVFEARFKAASSGGRYGGIVFRAWEGPNVPLGAGGGSYVVRYASGSGTQVSFIGWNGSTFGSVAGIAAPTGLTINANDVWDIKLELRGRVIQVFLRNVTAGGSYVLQFTHTIVDVATSDRGLLCQDNAGPYVDGTFSGIGTDNYCTAFTYTGRTPPISDRATIGNLTFGVESGSIKELYHSASGEPTTNLFWDRGIQFSHRSEMDIAESYNVVRTIVAGGVHVKSYRQRGILMSESRNAGGGVGDSYITLLRRGPWVADGVSRTWGSSNWGVDNDLRPTTLEIAGSYKTINAAGTINTLNYLPHHDWRNDSVDGVLPIGQQIITAYSGAPLRATVAQRNITGAAALTFAIPGKATGSGAPFSFQHAVATLGDGLNVAVARAWLIQAGAGLALDDTTLTQWRNDVATPATLTIAVGALKTNAAGDVDTDGFNERHGWHEVTCAGGIASFTLVVASGKRFGPAFRLWSHTLGPNPTVTIAGVAGVSGTDYVWDDFGDGTGLLQLLTDRTANTAVILS